MGFIKITKIFIFIFFFSQYKENFFLFKKINCIKKIVQDNLLFIITRMNLYKLHMCVFTLNHDPE